MANTSTPPANNPDLTTEDRFLTVSEVASMWRVSKMTVYRMVHSGELPCARIGRSLRVPREATRAHLAAQLATSSIEQAAEHPPA